MITVTVYLNQTSRFDSYKPFRAELLKAAEFTVPGIEPEFDFDYEAAKDLDNDAFDEAFRAARAKHEEWVYPILARIFEQLNVGGDMVPAEDYTVAYRMAGHRSLSVGDLVTFEYSRPSGVARTDGSPIDINERHAYSVERFGWKRQSVAAVRKGVEKFEANEGSDEHFLPVPRTDLAVDENGLFALAQPEPRVTTFAFVQEDLRGGL